MVYMASFDTEDVADTFSLLGRTLPRVAYSPPIQQPVQPVQHPGVGEHPKQDADPGLLAVVAGGHGD